MLGMEKLEEDFFPKKQGCSIFLGKQNKISDSDFHSHHLWMILYSFSLLLQLYCLLLMKK